MRAASLVRLGRRGWLACLGLVACAAGASSDARLGGGHDLPAASAVPVERVRFEEPEPVPAVETPAEEVVIAFGGDVNLGRHVGQRILAVAGYDPFAGIAPFLADADLTVVNLESPISEQNGQTRHPTHPNVFTGPPDGARTLAAAGVDIASVANNHAWDYGLDGFLQTLRYLTASGVAPVGGAGVPSAQYEPAVRRVAGRTVAVFAATGTFNPGVLVGHEAEPYVADADAFALLDAVARARRAYDVVVVSLHVGKEYSHFPQLDDQARARALIDAGADAVVGHHPHVVQGISWHRERPIVHSLGNLVFGVHRDHDWAGRGVVARVTLRRSGPGTVALCPFALVLDEPHRLTDVGMDRRVAEVRDHLVAISEPLGGLSLGATDARGCFEARPAERPPTGGGSAAPHDRPR